VPGSELKADLWITEYITPWDVYHHGVTAVLAYRKTAFQEMHIVETGAYGKALVLDGKWQSSTVDEFLYHEALVQPACVAHGAPGRVLVLGGGEGATVREALRWRSVREVTMVDIDGEVVAACREHLPEMHQGAFEDPRTRLVIGDALHILDESEAEWDVIISDLSDPIVEGPSFPLFTREYFEKCRRALRPGGWFVVQGGPVGPVEMAMHVRLSHTVGAVFPWAASYTSYVPAYATPWAFVLAGERPFDFRQPAAGVDALLAEGTSGGLRMFDGTAMQGLFLLPAHLRAALAAETRVFSLAEPPRFFGKGVAGADRAPPPPAAR
jgi:spermidine synthase